MVKIYQESCKVLNLSNQEIEKAKRIYYLLNEVTKRTSRDISD